MTRSVIAALMLFWSPMMAVAEQAGNLVTGTVGDADISAPIWSEQSDFYGEGNAGGVSMMTRPVAPEQGLGSIAISFEGSDFLNEDFSSFEVHVADIEAGHMSGYYADLDNDLQVVIAKAEKQDGVLSLSGSVQGSLIWRKLMPVSERREDPSRGLSINLSFDVKIENEY